ncbi:ATP-binding protein [candidate division KSB1 bacterium]|nr:ATP-binding protein [candidate division KSB1 bacterium]
MKTKNIKIESSTSKIQQAVQKLERFLNSNGLYERIINEATIAVSEAIANAVIHGNQNDPDKYVSVDVKLNGKKLTVKVSDEGTGFSPTAIPNPLNGENRMKTSGRGVYLMKATMDEVNFNLSRKGLEVELIKFLSDEHKNSR